MGVADRNLRIVADVVLHQPWALQKSAHILDCVMGDLGIAVQVRSPLLFPIPRVWPLILDQSNLLES